MIGLLLTVRDGNDRAACVGQAVVMMIATAMTVVFQFLLNDATAPLLRFIPYRDIDTDVEEEHVSSELEHDGRRKPAFFGNAFLTYLEHLGLSRDTTSWDDVFSELSHVKEDIAKDSLAFQHGSLCVHKPVIWIPEDPLGISDDEVSCIKREHEGLKISNRYATLDGHGRITIMREACELSDLTKL